MTLVGSETSIPKRRVFALLTLPSHGDQPVVKEYEGSPWSSISTNVFYNNATAR